MFKAGNLFQLNSQATFACQGVFYTLFSPILEMRKYVQDSFTQTINQTLQQLVRDR